MEQKTPSKGKIALRILLVLLVLLLAAALLGFGYIWSKLNLLDRPDPQESPSPEVSATLPPEESSPPDEEEEADNQAMMEAAEGLEEQDSVMSTGSVASDPNVTNILLIGTDERSDAFSTNARGDACMLLSINKSTGVIHLVSFERGMGVPILEGQYAGQYDWLTHTFRYGGAELMMKEIQECFKVEVSRYVRVNFYTFIAGINAIGGVDLSFTQAEATYINTGCAGRDGVEPVSVGLTHVNGETALVYARLREIDSDWSRIGRQRAVIQAAVDQVKGMGLLDLNSLLDTVLPLVQTNLTNEEILSLAMVIPQFWGSDMVQATIPLRGTYGSMKGMGGRTLFAVDFETNAQALREMLYGTE